MKFHMGIDFLDVSYISYLVGSVYVEMVETLSTFMGFLLLLMSVNFIVPKWTKECPSQTT